MSRDGSIPLTWPDEERIYRLRIKELRELQERCGNRGPMRILHDLDSGNWLVDDIIQPIRLGLIGSGAMDQGKAAAFVARHLGDGRLKEGILIARAIVAAAIVGPPDEELDMPGSDDDPAGKTKAPPADSGSAPSGEQARPSDSDQTRSIN